MATGIVSVALFFSGRIVLAHVLFALAGAGWGAVATGTGVRLMLDRRALGREAATPLALSTVAATGVVGSLAVLVGWSTVGVAALAAGFLLWAALLPRVLRRPGWRSHGGASFLVTVASESLAVLAAALARRTGATWLAIGALGAFAIGITTYLLVLVAFDAAQLEQAKGDQWVAGGALAIGSLAAGLIASASQRGALGTASDPLSVVALVLWALAVAWVPVLLVAEARSRRPSYHPARWSTVFPLGMYAASTFVVGRVNGIAGLIDAAKVWVWVAAAAWLVVLGGMLRGRWRRNVSEPT